MAFGFRCWESATSRPGQVGLGYHRRVPASRRPSTFLEMVRRSGGVRTVLLALGVLTVVLGGCSGDPESAVSSSSTATTTDTTSTTTTSSRMSSTTTTTSTTTTVAPTTTTGTPGMGCVPTFPWMTQNPAPLGLLGRHPIETDQEGMQGLATYTLAGCLVSTERVEVPAPTGLVAFWVATFDFGPHPEDGSRVLSTFFIGEAGNHAPGILQARLSCPILNPRLDTDPAFSGAAATFGLGCDRRPADDLVESILEPGTVYGLEILLSDCSFVGECDFVLPTAREIEDQYNDPSYCSPVGSPYCQWSLERSLTALEGGFGIPYVARLILALDEGAEVPEVDVVPYGYQGVGSVNTIYFPQQEAAESG